MRKFNQSGQALLVVLLSLSVVLIIVLYIVSRSITDISLSVKDEEALRAFSAAEAGIERALVIGSTSGEVSDANFTANVSNFAQGSREVVYPIALKSGNTATFWFSRPSETGFTGNELKLCWGEKDNAEIPAIEVAIIYATTPNDFSTLRIARVGLDPNTARASSNYFSTTVNSNCTIDSQEFAYQSTINLTSLGITNFSTGALQFAKVRMLYNTSSAQKIGLDVTSTGSSLPSQGKIIDSEGSYGLANRRIEVYQLHPVAPSIFDSVVFSSSGITK